MPPSHPDSPPGGRTDDPPFVTIDDGATLESVVSDHRIALGEFYADWCGPCRAYEPILEEFAAESSVPVARIDVERNPPLAGRFDVRGVPTTVVFVDGQPTEHLVGVRGKAELVETVERHG